MLQVFPSEKLLVILQYLCGGQHINNMATSPNEISSEEAEEREYVTSAKNQVSSI